MTVKRLKQAQVYYFRIRGVKDGKKGRWSKIKKVVVKGKENKVKFNDKIANDKKYLDIINSKYTNVAGYDYTKYKLSQDNNVLNFDFIDIQPENTEYKGTKFVTKMLIDNKERNRMKQNYHSGVDLDFYYVDEYTKTLTWWDMKKKNVKEWYMLFNTVKVYKDNTNSSHYTTIRGQMYFYITDSSVKGKSFLYLIYQGG